MKNFLEFENDKILEYEQDSWQPNVDNTTTPPTGDTNPYNNLEDRVNNPEEKEENFISASLSILNEILENENLDDDTIEKIKSVIIILEENDIFENDMDYKNESTSVKNFMEFLK